MKKLSNFHRKVLNIVVTLMAAIALMLGNVTSVAAYTDINGYPFVMDDFKFGTYTADSSGNVVGFEFLGQLKEQNSYFFDVNTSIDGIYSFVFGNSLSSFVLPLNIELYDYYLVGTLYFNGQNNGIDSFDVSQLFYEFSDDSGNFYTEYFESFNTMEFQNVSEGYGKSFYGKIGLSDFSNLSTFRMSVIVNGSFLDDVWFSASVVPVPKSGTEADTLNSILQTLTQINQNIITGNTLQQQTIDAINQNTTNTSNWFTTLITTMQGWFNTQTENLRTWFYMIEERMSAGFTALYHQMTREQDEKLNGYTDITQSDAADNFNTESDKLTQLEDQLNNQSHDFVSDYSTTGFNTGVLTTLSSSLIFVTTWFANFWNMGGIFTSGLNFCFSLSIVFFILRFRR